METINLRFTLDRCANIEDLLDSDDIFQVISQPDCFQVIVEDVDEWEPSDEMIRYHIDKRGMF